MRRPKLILNVLAMYAAMAGLFGAQAIAEPTQIDVRVLSRQGKFIGTSMGGAEITIRDAATGQLLAQGRTEGTTGDTGKIMKEPRGRHAAVSTPDSAVFHATIDLDEPRQIEVVARGPLAQPQAMNTLSATQWVIPGKHITGGDAFILEMPGFAVDVLQPPAHQKLSRGRHTVELHANVVLMCGCPIEPNGLWDANRYEVAAILKRNGNVVSRASLSYAARTSQFATSIEIVEPGAYEVIVYAYDPASGNTGVDKTSFIVGD